MSDDLFQDDSLIQDYLTECDDLLAQLDQDLITLEGNPQDDELLNRAFRALHTIKGTSGFMGFTSVVEISHKAEDVLNLLRKHERGMTRATMDALLAVLDLLRTMMEDIRARKTGTYELTDALGALQAILDRPEDAPLAAAPPPAPAPSPAPALAPPPAAPAPTASTQASGKKPAKADVARGARAASEPTAEPETTARNETTRARGKGAGEGEASIRVAITKLDELVNLVGELVLERNRLLQLGREALQQSMSESYRSALEQATNRLSFLTGELQMASLKTRMVPVETVFRRIPRMVRDISNALLKEVDLQISGEETEIDRNLVEAIADPLVHLIRNSLDHGIEPPEVRRKKGKPAQGTVRLDASQQGDQIVITLEDDGAGIDPERIGKKAVEKGMVSPERLRTMSRQEIMEMIFLPGFSTAEKVSDVSGRGVGMDVVRSNLKKLNGTVELESEVNIGTTMRMILPLTLAIIPVLLVKSGGDVYGIPLRSVVEIVRVPRSDVHRVDGVEVLHLRGDLFTIQQLERLLGQGGGDEAEKGEWLRVVILAVGEKRYGLAVDDWLGQEETVVKPLSTFLGHISGVSGATISGDGHVRLVLDPAILTGTLQNLQA